MDKTLARLKQQAAEVGANGILLEGVGDQEVGTGFGMANANSNHAYGTGFAISDNAFAKTGKGLAIYVPPTSWV
jgi:hypothetical protein